MEGVQTAFAFGESHHITVDASLTFDVFRQKLTALGHQEIQIEEITPSIEDCFMHLQN